jgi:DNA-binding MarR family transcriptional regulator
MVKNHLTKGRLSLYFVHSMNQLAAQPSEELLIYQAQRLEELIAEMIQCCEDRKFFETNKFGLPYAEVKCLLLFGGERYLTVKGIAQRLDVAKSRVTKIVNGLVARGLVRQVDDPNDARIKLIGLTSAGEEKAREIAAFQRGLHRQILLHLSSDERKGIFSYLELLRSAMESVKSQLK